MPPVPDLRTQDDRFARLAFSRARKACSSAGEPKAGAVVISSSGAVVAEGFSGELEGMHAAELAVLRAGAGSAGGTLYTTSEPCEVRASGTPSCVDRIVESGVARVVIGQPEPACVGVCHGTLRMEAAGIIVDTLEGYHGIVKTDSWHLLQPHSPILAPTSPRSPVLERNLW
ncbi:cytidine deaminase-like protein [Hyaloraphidium curvatum]|nr:cytidine deaminase-like protein [Hyaloraphidium curvatum]